MTSSPASIDPGRLPKKIAAGIERAKPTSDDGDSAPSPTEAAKELLDVVESTGSLVETIDLDRLPEVIESEELPSIVDFERLSDAIRERNLDLALDLSNLRDVVDEKELWNSVDLLEFETAKRRAVRELEDVLGEDALVGFGGDSEAVSDIKEYISSIRAEAKKALIQQEATAKAESPRRAIVEQHAAIERLYESNKDRLQTATDRKSGRNLTSVSLLPSGPLPDSVSTRLSTVPSDVPHAKIRALPRIYGRRWRNPGSKRPR